MTLDLPLTPDEYHELSMKLHSGAHKLFEVGHTLAQVALTRVRDDRGKPDDQADTILWTERDHYLAARAELAELADAASADVLAGCETADA